MNRDDLTVVIVARNAEATLARAIVSVREQSNARILLVNDASIDETSSIGRTLGCEKIIDIPEAEHSTLGAARQRALESIETSFAMILDADDSLLPCRIGTVLEAFEDQGADLIFDSIELWNGLTDTFIKEMNIPKFMLKEGAAVRLFERNYLPGIGQVSFRTEFVRTIGYDSAIHGPEDYDLVLRCIDLGAKVSCLQKTGYRMYAYPQSVSRNLRKQKEMVSRVLRKFSDRRIAEHYSNATYDKRVLTWALSSMAVFRGDYVCAIHHLVRAVPDEVDYFSILEPDGPEPFPEGWRFHFSRGTCFLLQNETRQAIYEFENAQIYRENTAELFNNLGVSHRFLGREAVAQSMFERALEIYPAYFDAKVNLNKLEATRITTHCLRNETVRDRYD